MEYQEEECDYSAIVDTIASMFGEIINKDVILTIVESCGGDLNLSVDAIMNITSDSISVTDKKDFNEGNSNQESISNNATGSSYAAMALKSSNITGEVHQSKNQREVKNVPIPNQLYFWTDKVREIIEHHKKCSRVMIIMRGAPGSGKTSLGREIVNATVGSSYIHYNTHIFSTDDFFMATGKYLYDKFKLCEAHPWNQNRVKMATRTGLSPIIVDNTNIELWEMEPYLRDGVKQGYIIEVLEPSTPWAWNSSELSKRNIHNVPKTTIHRMLDNYNHNITGEMLIEKFRLRYPANKVPPVLRALPSFSSEIPSTSSEVKISKPLDQNGLNHFQDERPESETIKQIIPQFVETTEIISEPECGKEEKLIKQESNNEDLKPIIFDGMNILDNVKSENDDNECGLRDKLLIKAQKQLDDLQKNELEWESNESWSIDNKENENVRNQNSSISVIKPKRSHRTINNESLLSEKFKDTVNECKDWSSISMFMTPWNDPEKTEEASNVSEYVPIEKVSSGTCLEIGDTDPLKNSNKYKVISANSRNINEFYIPFNKEKIPDKRMLDKSSMTNEDIFKQPFRCQNEEKHFSSFKKLFPKVATADLRDIFDKCCGNVNWAVDIVIDSMANNLLHTADGEDLSDIEEDNLEQCQCLAVYNIIPDRSEVNTLKPDIDPSSIPGCSKDIMPQPKKKIKKVMSDSSLLLKSQIEQNVVISDSHYSEHCLRIKKSRHGDNVRNDGNVQHSVDSDGQELATVAETHENTETEQTCDYTETEQSDDEESNISMDEFEKVVPVNLGMDFVKVLDSLFDRDIIYPPNIEAKFNLSSSLLNELNAIWMESLMHQFEDDARNATKRDEEFARELAMKEAELLQAGKEPAVPDFKEIMDMELALHLYQKDVDEWKSQQPNDLAAKLSREKLFNLFPDVSQETLMEMLMAHKNNFQETVEVLLISMGKNDIVDKPNGVKKFIMDKEMERQQKVLEQERKALSEIEWPLLTKGEVIEMSAVQGYREAAEKHLERRNTNYNKAREYVQRGMTHVAFFYSEMSSYHRRKYEYANGMAAISLIQINTSKNPDSATIDLHYLRVSEARESLDIFIDFHIQQLRELHSRGGPRANTLFLITGRGLHSPGGPRIKPAVIKRLRQRKMKSRERNPGLLSVKVTADNLLSHELKSNGE